MGTRRSGFDWPGAQTINGSAAVRWLRRACASVRSCGPSREFLRCWLSVRRRGSAVLSFCLDWKREGPVVIKVGGSPKSRQAAAYYSCRTCSSVFQWLSEFFFFFGTVHNACFVWENPNYSKTPWRHNFRRVPGISDSNSHVFFLVLWLNNTHKKDWWLH